MSDSNDLSPGDTVIVRDYRRAKGYPSGWKPFTWRGEVVQVNRVTVDVRREGWHEPQRYRVDRVEEVRSWPA